MKRSEYLGKTVFDRTVAVLTLVAVAPLLVCAAALIKLRSPGPLLFVQQRVGRGERPFRIFKFRTMHVASETHDLGSVTVAGDPRVFRGARLLRKWKIDELPQLWNVLNGTMSIVGPRPTVTDDYERMTPAQRRRATVKPGITGLAQIRGGAAISWPERIRHDLWYVDHCSLWLDVKIVFETAWRCALGQADSNPTTADEWNEPVSETDSTRADARRAA